MPSTENNIINILKEDEFIYCLQQLADNFNQGDIVQYLKEIVEGCYDSLLSDRADFLE